MRPPHAPRVGRGALGRVETRPGRRGPAHAKPGPRTGLSFWAALWWWERRLDGVDKRYAFGRAETSVQAAAR